MRLGQGTRQDLVNNINELTRTSGTSKSYTISRLKKHRPDLFAKVVANELSANAAAIQAGFRKVKTPEDQLWHWWGKASKEERDRFKERIS